MNTIQQNINSAKDAENAVRNHCMCAKYEMTGTHYRVLYPEGYFPNGVQVSKRLGKIEGFSRLLAMMERHWRESFP
jgi:hypothetical protein